MSKTYMDLSGRNAVVTGAAQGIGRAIAERLSNAGARVALADIDGGAAEATAGEIGGDALGIQADVAHAASVRSLVQSVMKTWDRIDILVNNAGIVGRDVSVRELTESDWDQVMNVNLKSVFLCSNAVIGGMIDRNSGSIVSVASISGKEGNPNMVPYSVSKAGIICFTKALAKEVISYGVRVNCVSPSLTRTPLLDAVEQNQIDFMTSKIPMGRLGRPEETAAAVHFLASDESSFTTGQCLDVSGGRATY